MYTRLSDYVQMDEREFRGECGEDEGKLYFERESRVSHVMVSGKY